MIIIQRNRILINDLIEDTRDKFIKINTIVAKKFTFGYETLWTALHEVEFNNEPFLAVPRNYPANILKKYVDSDVIEKDLSYVPYKKVDILNDVKPRDSEQESILDFLHGKGEYSDIESKPRRALFADTGVGKTFCTLKYISDTKLMSCIFCPDEKAIKTWMDEIATFTNIQPEEICIVKGATSVQRIIKNKERYKIILFSNKTASSLIDSKKFTELEEFFTEMKVGLKVFDEVHLHIRVFFFIEMTINTFKTFYLTATDSRRIFSEDRVLHNLIPEDACVYRQPQRERFDFIEVLYHTNPTEKLHTVGIQRPNGFDSLRYLKYILNESLPYKDFFLTKVIKPAIKLAIKLRSNPSHRIALLFKTIDSGDEVSKYLETEFPNLKIGFLNSRITDINLRMQAIEGVDIIISTDKSFAGIINIKGLEVIINTTPVSTNSHINQIIGRLRDEPNKGQWFIQLVDLSFKKAKSMLYREKQVIKDRCISMRTINVNSAQFERVDEE